MTKQETAIKFANQQIKKLEKEKRNGARIYSVLSIILSLINLTVFILASIALSILVPHIGDENTRFAVIMASFAAAITMSIFAITTINLIFRSLTKRVEYKKGYDAIEVEQMAFKYNQKEYSNKGSEEILEKNVNKIYKHTLKKSKKKWLHILMQALSGGKDA